MAIHDLKCQPPHFADVAAGRKRVEIRFDDRGYQVGDVLHLREWNKEEDPDQSGYTGRTCDRVVTHCLRDAPAWVPEGYVAMSLAELPTEQAPQTTPEQRAELARLADSLDVEQLPFGARTRLTNLARAILTDLAAAEAECQRLRERCKRLEEQLANDAAGASSGVIPDGAEASYIRIVNIGDLGYVAGFPTISDFTKYRDGVALCCAEAESGRLGDEPYVLALDWPVGRFTADEQRALLVALKASFKARLDDESRDASRTRQRGHGRG